MVKEELGLILNNLDNEIFSNHTVLGSIFFNDYNGIAEDFSCLMCFGIYYKKEIYQCRNGHLLCKNCWMNTLKKASSCLVCGDSINSFDDLSRSRFIEQLLLKKEILCPFSFKYSFLTNLNNDDYNNNSGDNLIKNNLSINNYDILELKDEDGCRDIIKVGDFEKHLSYCAFRFIKCENKECNEIIRFNKLSSHLKKCKFSKVNCRFCNEIFAKSKLNSHLENYCPLVEIKCKLCSIKLLRKSLNDHIKQDCQNSIIKCKYSDFGCTSSFKRSNLTNHLQSINHSTFMNKFIEMQEKSIQDYKNDIEKLTKSINNIYDLASDFKKENKVLKVKNQILEKELSDLKIIFHQVTENVLDSDSIIYDNVKLATILAEGSYQISTTPSLTTITTNELDNELISQCYSFKMDDINIYYKIEVKNNIIEFHFSQNIDSTVGINVEIKTGFQKLSFYSEKRNPSKNSIYVDTEINLEYLNRSLNNKLNFDYSILNNNNCNNKY